MDRLNTHIDFPHPGHLNGSSASVRVDDGREVLIALKQARHYLAKTAPHPRDWQAAKDPKAYQQAREVHEARLAALQDLETAIVMEVMQWMEAS